MTLSRRIARNRRRELALAAANVSVFEVAARSDSDPVRQAKRLRILDKVRDFAAHVHEPDLDKAWAFLVKSSGDYDHARDGNSRMMAAVREWMRLDNEAAERRDETATIDARQAIEEETKGMTAKKE